MTAIKVRKDQFVGTSKVFGREPDALAAIIRGLAIDSARLKVEVSGVADFVDNTTGTTASVLVNVPIPATAIDATSAGGTLASALNTSLGKIQNAGLVVENVINTARTLLGLPLLTGSSGTEATAGTIPAQTLAGTGGTGAAAASFASAVAALNIAKSNLVRLIRGADEVFVALGVSSLAYNQGSHVLDLALVAIPTVTTSAAGLEALALTDATAFLAAYANNVATLAATWNAALNQGTPGAGPLHVVAA
jgi:hypothetical protein